MKRKDWLHLASIPDDIRRREARIRQLEQLQAAGPCEASDTVKSSTDAGEATILCHLTVHGTDNAFAEREQRLRRLRGELRRLNTEYNKQYTEAVQAIEAESDPVMRCVLHDVLLDGKRYTDLERQAEGNPGSDAYRKRVSRWIENQAE